MTLVLALRAQDGVVMASDGQATSATGVPTKTSTEKLDVLHEKIVFGCAGDAGLRQRGAKQLQAEISAEQCELPFEEIRDDLHAVVNKVQKHAEQAFVRKTLMDEGPAVEVLFGGVSAGEPWVYEVSGSGGDQRHELGEAIGHGRHFAAYALNSADHYELTTCGLRQVRLLAYRAVDDAIRTDATALGHPVHLVEVTGEGARRLSDNDLSSVKTAVNAWQGHESEIFSEQGTDLVASSPEAERGIDPPQG
jgi:20S proteasome alpha/beta subunit